MQVPKWDENEDDFKDYNPCEWCTCPDTPDGGPPPECYVPPERLFEEPTKEEFEAAYPGEVAGRLEGKIDFIRRYDPDNDLGFQPRIEDLMLFESRHPNSARFHEILEQLGELHDRKQADYGKGDDPFANVRSSEEWGVEGWKGAMIRLNDKVKRLQNYARNGTLKNEGVVDSFMDIAVYAVIAQVLWEQEQG